MTWTAGVLQDLRFALRQYRKEPGFTLLAVLTLALGIGATTAVYTVVHAVLLRPLPFADSDSLVMVWDNAPQDGDRFKAILVSREDVDQYSRSSRTLGRFTSAGRIRPTLNYGGINKRVLAGLVTDTMFRETLGSQPLLGRTFVSDDLQAGCVVVLANSFWRRVLGSDPTAVGKSLAFDDTSCVTVGVMPSGFDLFPIQADMWFLRDHAPRRAVDAARRGGFLTNGIVYARLRPGVQTASAERELTELHRRLHANEPNERSERERVVAVTPVRSAVAGVTAPSLSSSLWLALGAVGLLLLIACVNVANLLLSRLGDRHRELAVRWALGSGRARLLRQLITEGFLLAGAGTALGIALVWSAIRPFRYLNPFELPTQAGDVELNLRVLMFAAGLSVATTIVFSIFPALASSRAGGPQALGRIRGELGGNHTALSLVAIELALSFVLLAGAGLLMSSAFNLEEEKLGFDVAGVASAHAEMPSGRYTTRDARQSFEQLLRERLKAVPGVTAVAFGEFPPNSDGGRAQLEIRGQLPEKVFDVDVRPGSRDYLDLLRLNIVRGRSFTDADRNGPPIAIVSQRLVDEYFKGVDPLGRSIRTIDGDQIDEWRMIVGVIEQWKHMVGDTAWRETPLVLTGGRTERVASMRYDVWVGVRSAASLSTVPREIQRQISSLEPAALSDEAEVLSERLSSMTLYARFRATLLTLFSLGSLLLGGVGVYGVASQTVVRRVPELGLRKAIGAGSGDLVWLVLRQGGVAAIVGLCLGAGTALAGAGVLSRFLYGVVPRSPQILFLVAAVLLAATMVAMLGPAIRAARVDPMTALRQE